MDWFRSWHGAPTDPKWLLIAQRTQTNAGMVSAVVWALFDHASQSETRGDVSSFDPETYAAFSGWEVDKIAAIVAALKAKGLIQNNTLVAWAKRQPKREDGSAERAKAWREQERTQANAPERKRPLDKIREDKKEEEGQVANFRKVGEVKANGPRHGAISPSRGTVFIRKGTDDWETYVEDYRRAFGVEPEPNQHGGFWFKIVGVEPIPLPKRLTS
jgi:hypothetical protein